MNGNGDFDTPKDTRNEKSVQIPPSSTEGVDNAFRTNLEWVTAKTRGRWAPFWNAQTRTYNPPQTEARKKARRQKYAWARMQNPAMPEYVPLHLCLSGSELLAERSCIRGDGTSFRVPRTDEARELVALLPHGRLRQQECMLLVAIAYAMLVRRRHGLVATVAELGELVGLRATATSEAMARLIALGFVRADATYTRYGACESQRGNLWRLTKQCLEAYGLRDVPEGVTVPTGTVDRARLQRRRTYPGTYTGTGTGTVGSRACATPRNPGANPDSLCSPVNKPESFRNAPRTDETRGESVSATPTRSIVTVPAGRHLPSPPVRSSETCQAPRGLRTGQVASSAASIVEELAQLVSDPAARAAILAAAAKRKGGAS